MLTPGSGAKPSALSSAWRRRRRTLTGVGVATRLAQRGRTPGRRGSGRPLPRSMLISRLLIHGNPFAVLGLVVAIIVYALDAVARWTRTHICKEVLERIAPAVADRNAAPSVTRPSWALWVGAAHLHSPPNLIFGQPRYPDLEPPIKKWFAVSQPTGVVHRTPTLGHVPLITAFYGTSTKSSGINSYWHRRLLSVSTQRDIPVSPLLSILPQGPEEIFRKAAKS